MPERCIAVNRGETHTNNVSLYPNVYVKTQILLKKHSSRFEIKSTYFIQLDINQFK